MYVIIKSTEQVVPHRAGIEIAVLVSSPAVEGPVPVQRQVLAPDAFGDILPDIPDLAGRFFPFLIEEKGAVREKGDIMAGGIELLVDLFRQGGHGKGAGALSGDHQLVRILEEGFGDAHGHQEILVAVKIKALLLSLFILVAVDIPAQVHVSGGIGDHDKIPVAERIASGAVVCDPDTDIKELCKGTEIAPVVIGMPCQDPAACHGTGSCVGVPCNAAAGQKNTQMVCRALSHINMIFRAVRCLSALHRNAVPLAGLHLRHLLRSALSGTDPEFRRLEAGIFHDISDHVLRPVSDHLLQVLKRMPGKVFPAAGCSLRFFSDRFLSGPDRAAVLFFLFLHVSVSPNRLSLYLSFVVFLHIRDGPWAYIPAPFVSGREHPQPVCLSSVRRGSCPSITCADILRRRP